jgi:LysM repeat protein
MLLEGFHRVEKGETLFGIAKRYELTLGELRALNDLSNDLIKVGQMLRVQKARSSSAGARLSQAPQPAESPLPQAPALALSNDDELLPMTGGSYLRRRAVSPAAAKDAAYVAQRRYHEVKRGETIYTIARAYGVRPEDIRAWNSIVDVRPGMNLVVSKSYDAVSLAELNRSQPPVDLRQAQQELYAAQEEGKGQQASRGEGMRVKSPSAPEARPEPPAPVRVQEGGEYVRYERASSPDGPYYAAHKTLPIGSRFQLKIPGNGGYLEVVVAGRLAPQSRYLVGLSPACMQVLASAGGPAFISIEY